VTAQPEHSAGVGPVPAIPHTINGIADALSGAERARFYSEVLAAEESTVATVMRRWWKTAMLNGAPGAETSRANASAGRRLVAVEDLAARLEDTAR
jgi:hypothetical protein